MDETTTILSSVKKLLNINESVTEFDTDIRSHINGALFSLYQLGVGPSSPFSISNETTWDEYDTIVPKDVVLDYLHLKTAMIFDPPTTSSVIEAYKDRISELEFRMNLLVDNGGGYVTG